MLGDHLFVKRVICSGSLFSILSCPPGWQACQTLDCQDDVRTAHNFILFLCWFKTTAFRPAGAPNPALKADGLIASPES
jgi:hypothetical protein